MSLYYQITDVGRDQSDTEQALTALRDVIQRFPQTDYARDAGLKVDLTLDHLAGKEMFVGRYYLRGQDYVAAINRFRTVVEKYQKTSQIAEALERLTEAYYALGVYSEAQTAAAVLGANYPGSPWYQDAYNLLMKRHLKPAGEQELLDQQGVLRHFLRICRMLATLRVRDLVLIEDVALEFAPGLNVLTGETGAGKSILLDALGLAAGNRAGARSSVRGEAAQGSAVAVFDLPAGHSARAAIAGNAIPADAEIILRRVISADGRTRAFVNDEPVGVGLLRELGETVVEIHGQSDDRGLFDAATHRRLLDAFGGYDGLLADVATRFAAFERARGEVRALRAAAASVAADAEYLRDVVDELTALAPLPDEAERLARERALLMNASRIAEDISAAAEFAGRRGRSGILAGRGPEASRPSRCRGACRGRRRRDFARTGFRAGRRGAARARKPACAPRWSTPANWSARRSVCSRCAMQAANMLCRPASSTSCLPIARRGSNRSTTAARN